MYEMSVIRRFMNKWLVYTEGKIMGHKSDFGGLLRVAGVLPVLLSVVLTGSLYGEEVLTPGEHAFNLEYRPNGFNVSVPVSKWLEKGDFEKEPDFGERDIVRGLLQTGIEEKDYMGFAWDKDNGRLYLDLNRNRDLTDDENGVFESRGKGTFQVFNDIHLEVQFDSVRVPYVIRMSLYEFGQGRPNCVVYVRSGFETEIELYGKKRSLAVADNMDGTIKYGRGDQFFLMPPEVEFGSGGGQFNLSIPEEVFFDGRCYELSFEFESAEPTSLMQAGFTEIEKTLGELNIKGTFIKRLVLESGAMVVLLDTPNPNVLIPVGNYHCRDVFLDGGEAGLFKVDKFVTRTDDISISESQAVDLKIGGPLKSTVDVQRMGNTLNLNYKLVGADGLSYKAMLQQRSVNPPGFAIYKGDKEIASGKFEYG